MTSNAPMAARPSETDPAEDAGAPTESFGRYLVRQRELRGMSLAQIAEQTRIGSGNLRALEQDDLARLPARVFVLGYIRAYAQAIGLNPDEAVLRYEEEWQRSNPPEDAAVTRKSSRARVAVIAGVVLALASAGGAWFLFGG